MPRPDSTPLGLQLARTAKAVSRAFDDSLAAAGGSLPVWLILLTVKTRQLGNQRELADAVGIQGATLTYHLTAMENRGLIERERVRDNRRVQLVRLTVAGEALFEQLAHAALAHDERLHAGFSEAETAQLAGLLARLADNVGPGADLSASVGNES